MGLGVVEKASIWKKYITLHRGEDARMHDHPCTIGMGCR
jgi:hypothetical protein